MQSSKLNILRLLPLLAFAILAVFPFDARAVPSFARQTGNPCSSCHVGSFGPELNDYGRQFKLNGYVWDGGKSNAPPLSAMVLGSFTSTAKDQPGGAAEGFGDNNNFAADQTSLFLAGKILPKVGAMIQATYDGVGRVLSMDNADIRYADQGTLAGKQVVYGLSINNNPTVEDLWHTTPAWGRPFIGSALAPEPGAATLIDGGLAQQVAGAVAYGMWDDLLYLGAGAYATLPAGTQRAVGIDPEGESQISGAAPYGRAVIQHTWGDQYAALGVFGLDAAVYPGRDKSAGTDHLTDVGADLSYSYTFADQSILSSGATFISEHQTLRASEALGLANNPTNSLKTFRAFASYTRDDTYSLTGGYFSTWGSTDTGLYAPDPIDGSRRQNPGSAGYLVKGAVIPFGKDHSWLAPWVNLQLGVEYIGYTKFNGAKANYDGFGRDAADNNTVFAFAWFAF